MRMLLAVLLSLCGFRAYGAGQPGDCVPHAWRTMQSIPVEQRRFVRFFWLDGDDPKERAIQFQILSGMCNALSTSPKIYVPYIVCRTGEVYTWMEMPPAAWEKATLAWIDIRWYGPTWTPQLYERLQELDPLFHVFDWKWDKVDGWQKVFGQAPWLIEPLTGQQQLPGEWQRRREMLSELSGYLNTNVPILQVDNFVWQTAVQFDRRAGYYDWLGIVDKKSYDSLVGFDEALFQEKFPHFYYPTLEAVSDSEITVQKVRRIEVYPKLYGLYVQTKDSTIRATGKRNPLTTLGIKELEFDAFETLANKANGWLVTGLFNKAGARQDSAPDGIGFDRTTRSNDGKIHIFKDCWQCHDRQPNRGGMHPIEPYFRSGFAEPGPLALIAKDKKLVDAYTRPLDLIVAQSQHTRAVIDSCGLYPNQFAAHMYDRYVEWERPYTLERAARRHGVTPEVLRQASLAYLQFYGTIDTVNMTWTKERKGNIGVEQFAEYYALGQAILRGMPPNVDQKWSAGAYQYQVKP